MFSSPQRGSFLSTIIQISSGADGIAVFSSPQRGSFLSTIMRERMVTRTVTRFRPLNGVLFYLHLKICLHLYSLNCFRPLNGVLFYLQFLILTLKEVTILVFVPSTGFFSIYLSIILYHIFSNKVFVPSTGFFSIYPLTLNQMLPV